MHKYKIFKKKQMTKKNPIPFSFSRNNKQATSNKQAGNKGTNQRSAQPIAIAYGKRRGCDNDVCP